MSDHALLQGALVRLVQARLTLGNLAYLLRPTPALASVCQRVQEQIEDALRGVQEAASTEHTWRLVVDEEHPGGYWACQECPMWRQLRDDEVEPYLTGRATCSPDNS